MIFILIRLEKSKRLISTTVGEVWGIEKRAIRLLVEV